MDGEEEAVAKEPEFKSGSFTFVDASKYEGEYKIDPAGTRTRHGQGKVTQGPEVCEGKWENDVLNGLGKIVFATGAVYEGAFVGGKFEGQGTYAWPDGASYVGLWRDNKMHGEGCYTDTDKVEWKGQYHNGKYFNGKAYATLR